LITFVKLLAFKIFNTIELLAKTLLPKLKTSAIIIILLFDILQSILTVEFRNEIEGGFKAFNF